ncbi:MAG: hypothetical protein IJ911_13825 [Salinivirgaceae bacterium]|nr:hypothetical protein [Salinivirgaceae bacterium]
MRKSLLLFAAAAMIAAACSQKSVEGEIEIILPEENNDASAFADALKSVKVINLQVDSNYMYNEEADLRVSDNYYYFLFKNGFGYDNNGLQLMCYEKATGKLLFSRNIKGRSQSECNEVLNSFVKDDKFVANDVGKLQTYDHTGKYCGMLGDAESDYVLPLKDGYIGCDYSGSITDGNKCLTLFDSKFNVKDCYFDIPKEYMAVSNIGVGKTSPDRYVFNDTLRFIYQYTFCLHSFPGNITYHFVPSNPVPKALLLNPDESSDLTMECMKNGYAEGFCDLAESNDYISFKYGAGANDYCVLYSKRDNKVFSISDDIDNYENAVDVWAGVFLHSHIIYSDGKYFYARADKEVLNVLEEGKDVLEERQRVIYEAAAESLAATEDGEMTVFYLKFEF